MSAVHDVKKSAEPEGFEIGGDITPPKTFHKKVLTGFLQEDIALWAGFDRVPRELKQYLGTTMVKHPQYVILDYDEAKRALAFCFHLHGLAALERLERAAKGREPGRTMKREPDILDPSRKRRRKNLRTDWLEFLEQENRKSKE